MAGLLATLAACGAIVLAAPGVGAAAGASLTQTPQAVAGTSSLSGIACPNSASCLTVGRNVAGTEGAAAAITDATPSKAKTASAAASLTSIACPTAATCLAVGENLQGTAGLVVPVKSAGAAGPAHQVESAAALNGIACPTATTCLGVGQNSAGTEGALVSIASSGAPGVGQMVSGTVSLNAIACSDPSTCLAVGTAAAQGGGTTGVVVEILNSVPQRPMVVDGTGSLSAIACPDACYAVGTDSSLSSGVVVPIAAGVPGAVLTPADTSMLLGISCPYAGTCLAVGSGPKGTGVVVPVVSGHVGSAQRVTGSALLSGVVCLAAGACDAVGTGSPGNQGVLVVAAFTPTATTLSSSANPIRIKVAVTYTAIVSPSPGSDPSLGTVQFTDDGTVISGCSAQPVNAGQATCATAYQTVDPDQEIVATFSGDGSSAPSTSAVLDERVNRFSSTTLAAASNKIDTGQPVTYTATVSPSPGSGSAAGTVAFTDGGPATSACAAQPIASGRAKCTVSYPNGGTFTVAAKYSGDNSVLIHSTSPSITETVIATTSTAVTVAPNPARTDQAVTYTATISPSPGSGSGAGTVTFSDGGVVLAACAQQPVTGGVATCTIPYPSAGSYSVVADYAGNGTFIGSKSAAVAETVIGVPSAPMDLTAASDNGGATLTWSAPTSDGGRPVSGYDVYEQTSTDSAFTGPVNGAALVTGTSVALDGLTNGTTYYFVVEGVNAVGNSPPSNQASAQPAASRPAAAVRGEPGNKDTVIGASSSAPGSSSSSPPGAGSSLFAGFTGSGGGGNGSSSGPGGNGGPSGSSASGGNPAATSGIAAHGRHASLAAFGNNAYANDGRGPDVDYARSVGTGLYGGPPGYVPLAQAVPTPLDVSWSPGHLLKDIGLAALLILLLALPAELLNLSFRAQGEKTPPAGSAVRRLLQPVERFFGRLPAAGAFAIVALAGSVLFALVDPTFGFDRSTLAEILGFVGAIAITTASLEFGRRHYLDSEITKGRPLRLFPAGIVAALILAGLSRLGHFEPGYMFGLLAVFAFAVKPTEARNGAAYAKAALWLLAICAAVWFAWIPVRHAVDSGHTGLGFLIFDSLMATTWVCGLSTLVFGFMPLRALPGGAVFAWSKGAWAVLYGFVVFVFVATVIRPTDAAFGANRHASLVSTLYPFLAFAVVAVVASTYVRLRASSAPREIVTSQPSPPQQWGW